MSQSHASAAGEQRPEQGFSPESAEMARDLVNQKIDFHGVLQTRPEFSKVGGSGIRSVLLKPFDAIFKKKPKGAEIPVKMTGTYSHPEPGLEITGGNKGEKGNR
jgi:hypothetical protein